MKFDKENIWFDINIQPNTIIVKLDKETMLEKYKKINYHEMVWNDFKFSAWLITKEQHDSAQFEHAEKVFNQRINEFIKKIREDYESGNFSEDNYLYFRKLIQDTFREYFDKDWKGLMNIIKFFIWWLWLFCLIAWWTENYKYVRGLKKEHNDLKENYDSTLDAIYDGNNKELVEIINNLQEAHDFARIIREINAKIKEFLNSHDFSPYQLSSEKNNESGYTWANDDLSKMKEIIEEKLAEEDAEQLAVENTATENTNNSKIETLKCAKNLIDLFYFLNNLRLIWEWNTQYPFTRLTPVDEETKADINKLIWFIHSKFNKLGIDTNTILNCTYNINKDDEVIKLERENKESLETLGIHVYDIAASFYYQTIMEAVQNEGSWNVVDLTENDFHDLLDIIINLFTQQRNLKEYLEKHWYNISNTDDLTNPLSRDIDDRNQRRGWECLGLINNVKDELERRVGNKFGIDFNNDSLKEFINNNLILFKIINSTANSN